MADLTQRVKYTVEVDSSALATLRLEISTGIIALESWEKGMRAAVEASKKAGSAFASVTSKMQANTLASARAELELKDLIKAQNAAGTASANLATHVAGLNTAFREMKSAGAQAKNAVENVQKASTAAAASAKSAGEESDKSGMTFLRLFGKFQAAKWIVSEVFQAIKAGAQGLDLDRTLGVQIKNYTAILEEARQKTAGMVSTAGLQKSMALMSSFGIPMEKFAESMELVQKMAIRTGQSSEFLTDSFGRAISRLSPLILDNLGIQVSLKEANELYAKSIGKSSDQLTKYESKMGFMNLALQRMKENTQGISLEGTSAVVVGRTEAALDDFMAWVKKVPAKAMEQIDLATDSSADTMRRAAAQYESGITPQLKAFNEQLTAGVKPAAETEEHMGRITRTLATMKELAKDGRVTDLFGGESDLLGFSKQIDRFQDVMFGPERQRLEGLLAEMRAGTTNAHLLPQADQDAMKALVIFQTYLAYQKEADAVSKEIEKTYGKILDKTQLAELKEKALGEARANAAAQVERIRKSGGMNLYQLDWLNDANKLKQAHEHIFNWITLSADVMVNLTREAERQANLFSTSVALMDERLGRIKLEQDFAEGLTFAAIQLRDIKTEENAVLAQIAKVKEDLATAEGSAKAEAAAKYQILLDELVALEKERVGKQRISDAEKKRVEEFKNGAKDIRDAEITRLTVLMNQAKVYAAQAVLIDVLNKLAGKPLIAGNEDYLAQAKNYENLIKQMQKETPRGGSGRPTKEKPEFGDQDDLEKMLADWNAFELEVRQSAGKIREEAQAASDEARGLMFGLSNQNPQTSISPKEYEETKKQWERVLELKNEFGTIIDMGLDEGAMSMLNTQFAELANHFEKIANMADGMHRFADGLQAAFAGMEGLVGGEYVAMMGDLVQGFEGLSQAIGENANAYGMMNAVAPIMRAFTHNLIKDRKAQAGIEMLMQGAAAWAAAATGNIPAAVAHGISAAMYGGIAGGLIKLPKGKASEDKPGADRNGKAAPRPDIHIYISGPIATTEAERGLMIRDALQAASRQGL